jgi:hypothetical protein
MAGSHEEGVGFCSYCGRLEHEGQRVCSECGLGVQLHTDAAVLRSPGSSFLVVRDDGIVSAASAAAERLLGDTVGRPVTTFLRHPDLLPAVVVAARGRPAPVTLDLPELTVTVAPCGLPPAALLVLERT